MPRSLQVKGLVWLSSGERNFGGPGRIALLEAIRTEGSITGAARRVGLSYKAAWDAVDTMNNLAGEPLVQRDDDREEVVRKRLDVYHSQTRPLVEYYSGWAQRGEPGAPKYRAISGVGPVDEVKQRAFDALA